MDSLFKEVKKIEMPDDMRERILEKCTRGNPGRRYAGMREVKRELEHWEEGIRKKYYAIQEKIAIDIHIIPLYFDVGAVLYNKRIQGQATPYRASIFNGIENLSLTE